MLAAYYLSWGDGALTEYTDAIAAGDDAELYDAVTSVFAYGEDRLSARTLRELERLERGIERAHQRPITDTRACVPSGMCHTMVDAGLALALAWKPDRPWRIFHGESFGREHSAIFDLPDRKIFDLMMLDRIEFEPCDADGVYAFCARSQADHEAAVEAKVTAAREWLWAPPAASLREWMGS